MYIGNDIPDKNALMCSPFRTRAAVPVILAHIKIVDKIEYLAHIGGVRRPTFNVASETTRFWRR